MTRQQRFWGIIAVAVCGAIGLAISIQGWRSRIPTFDLITAVESAQDLLDSGRLPDRGILTSLASYTPPGVVWLMLPGELVFKDPRLFEFVGSGILFLGTLAGIFLLARTYFGVQCAFLAVGFYAFSELGLFYSASLWPRGQPFFYVWMVYWAGQWATQKRTKFLAASITTWAVGMYVFMEIAPALFILPVIWFFYRPPLQVRPLLIAGVLILAVWFPFLRFEYTRNFVDLRSQLLLQRALPANYRDSWCDPHLVLRSAEVTASGISADGGIVPPAPVSLRTKVLDRLGSLWGRWNWLPANFEHSTKIPGNSLVLTLLALMSLCLISIPPAPTSATTVDDQRRRLRNRLAVLAAGMILFALLCNELVIARFGSEDGFLQASTVASIRWFQALLVGAGIILLTLKTKVAAAIVQLTFRDDGRFQFLRRQKDAKLFCISLLVPWVILLLVVESVDHLERFWWIWPLQLIALVALVTYIPEHLRLPRVFAWTGSGLLAAMLLLTPFLLVRAESWQSTGWSGSDATEIRLVNYMAQRLEGRDQASVGYQIFIWRFMATFNAVDPRYKVGADFDLLYKDLHGITNLNQCGEGVSARDEFRIVQTNPTWTDPRGKGHFEVSLDSDFHEIERLGPYRVYQRF